MTNQPLNEGPNISEGTKSSSREDTSIDERTRLKYKKKRWRRKQKKTQNSLQNHVSDKDLGQDSLLQNAPLGITSTMDPAIDNNDSHKRKHDVLDSNDIHNDNLENTYPLKSTPSGADLSKQPSVCTDLKEDSEIVNHDQEVSLNQEIDQAKELKEIYNSMESNFSQSFRESDGGPNKDIVVAKCLEEVDANSVSEDAEQLNSERDCEDTASGMKLDEHVEDVISSIARKLAKKKERRKISRMRLKLKKKSIRESFNSFVPVNDGVEGNSFGHSNETIPSLCASEILPDSEPTLENSKKGIEMDKSRQAIEEVNLLKDVSMVDILEENFEPSQRSKLGDQNVEVSVWSAEDNNCSCSKVCREEASDDYGNDSSLGQLNQDVGGQVCPAESNNGGSTNVSKDESPDISGTDSFLEQHNQEKMEVQSDREDANFVQAQSKARVHQDVEGNICPAEDNGSGCKYPDVSGIDSSHSQLNQEQIEIQSKIEDANSHLKLKEMEENVSKAVIEADQPPQVLHSSPERALTTHLRRKLLILDVNGVLVDIVPYVSDGYEPDTIIGRKAVFKRPFCDDFLQFCFERFNVGVWTSRTQRNVEPVLDFLMGNSNHKLLFCWDQSHCTETNYSTIENRDKPLLFKELKKLWEKQDPSLPWERGEYDESNTLLLDDSPYKALLNPPYTAIFPYSYGYKDAKDRSLAPKGNLRVYLEKLAAADDVREYVKENPFGQRPISRRNASWGFYLKVMSSVSSKPEESTSRR